ncbi:hypothetical protein [Soonwooa sp.]|uniref:hypothetical protein n=1 Tax=Soonwooa sp. TaxID=1938592 RepID=UPI002638CF55|nr:hypothetical protein [Soonwooa sp.]
MNKTLQILFFLVSIFSFSQKKYNFDKELVYSFYKGDQKKNVSEESIFINSEDHSYYLRIFGSGNQKLALLYDAPNNVRHDFDLIKNAERSDNYYEFKFDRSIIPKSNQSFRKPIFEIESSQISFYNNESRKKISKKITFKDKAYDSNLFFAFRAIALHPFESITELDPHQNILVENAKITTGKQILNYELKSIKDFNLTLTIPNKN